MTRPYGRRLSARKKETMDETEWKNAKMQLDHKDQVYALMARMSNVNVNIVRKVVIAPLLQRYKEGERTQELYDEMLAVE